MSENYPGKGLWGWLGRQVGYVRQAARHHPGRHIIWRAEQTQDTTLPDRPDLTLRRTTIDEVIVHGPPRQENQAADRH